MKPDAVPLSDEMLAAVARRFRLLGEPARLSLLQWLESGEQTVNELAEKLGGNQANVSRHLTAMYDGGLLKRRPIGTRVYYSIADPMVLQLCELVCKSTREQIRIRLGALGAGGTRKRRGTQKAKGTPQERSAPNLADQPTGLDLA